MHSYDPAKGFPRVAVELAYEDSRAALDWLIRVFRFRELLRFEAEDGSIGHADLELEGGIVMLGDGGRAARGAAHTWGEVMVSVSDVDAHYERVKAAGADIVKPPEDKPWGLRSFRALDLEGHVWEFAQHVREVPPEEWGATPSPPRA